MACVFLGGLAIGTKEDEIEDFFRDYGHVSEIQIRSKGAGSKDCFAFVTFEDDRVADSAIAELAGKRFNGGDRRVTMEKATPKGQNKDRGYTIWVGGLPEDVTEDDIISFCKGYGTVNSVNIKAGSKDTFAFVCFEDERYAKKCMAELDQTDWFGDTSRKIKLAPSQKENKTSWQQHGNDYSSKRDRSRSPAPWKGGGGGGDHSSKKHCPFWEKGTCKFGDECRNFHAEKSRSGSGRAGGSSSFGDGGKPGHHRIELRDLPEDMQWNELKDIARGFGPSVSYTNLKHEDGIVIGVVEFRERSDAKHALEKFDGKRISGHKRRLKAVKLYE